MPEAKSFTIESTGPRPAAKIDREGFIVTFYSSEKVSPLVFVGQFFVDAQHLSNLAELVGKIKKNEPNLFQGIKPPESNI